MPSPPPTSMYFSPGADPVQLDVDAGRLGQGVLDVADVGDLAAQVEVDQLQAVLQPLGLQVLERVEHLGQRQPELRAVAGAGPPPPGAAGRQLDAHADRLADVELLHVLDDQLQLAELLDDRDDVLAELAGQHGHLDELVVLEAVADDRRAVAAVGQGQHGEQLGLGAGLQAEAVRLAEVEDLLDDLPLLVDLDRVDAAVPALVAELGDRLLEGVGDLADAVAEDVGEAQQDRQLDAAVLELIDQLLEVDGLVGVLVRVDGDVALVVDAEVALAPVADAVGIDRVLHGPLAADVAGVGGPPLDQFAHQSVPRGRGGVGAPDFAIIRRISIRAIAAEASGRARLPPSRRSPEVR